MGQSALTASLLMTGRGGWYTRGLCWHPEGTQQAGEMGWNGCHKVQQELTSPTLGEEQCEAQICAEVLAEKHPGVLVGTKLIIIQQCSLKAKKVNGVLGCIRRGVANKLREVILSFCSALVRPLLECWAQSWTPQYKRDSNKGHEDDEGCGAPLLWGNAWRAVTVQPEEENPQNPSEGSHQCVFTHLKGGYKEDTAGLFPLVPSVRTRGHGHKLNNRKLPLWGSPSTDIGCQFSKAVWKWSWAIGSRWPCLSMGGWPRWHPEVPLNLNNSVALWT